jgi:ketosteroid isomerase-like protein
VPCFLIALKDGAATLKVSGDVSDAEALLRRYLKAQEDKDLDALVSCWHPDIEIVHPMRPDRNWRGLDTYRRQWKLIWELTPDSRFEVVSTAVVTLRKHACDLAATTHCRVSICSLH